LSSSSQGSDLVEPVNLAIKRSTTAGSWTEVNLKYFVRTSDITYDDLG
jgi:hypothetical protein